MQICFVPTFLWPREQSSFVAADRSTRLLTTGNFGITVYWRPSSLLFSFWNFLLKQTALYTHDFCVSVTRRWCLYSVLKSRINIFSVSMLKEFIPVQPQLARRQLPCSATHNPHIKSFGWLLHYRLWLHVKDPPGTWTSDQPAIQTWEMPGPFSLVIFWNVL